MRVPQIVSDFLEWRWAPCVGLTAGSLAFVALALLLIPTRFAGEPRASSTLSSFENPRPQRALFASSLARDVAEPSERRIIDERHALTSPEAPPQRIETAAAPQRGFSPPLERPDPPQAAPVAATPEPVPGSVVVIQPVPGGESRESIVQ